MSKISRQFTLESGRSVAATGFSPAIEVSQDDGYSIAVVFTGLATGASGTVTLQVSLDDTNFANYASGNQNYSSGTSTLTWEVTSKRHRFARMAWTAVASGSGTAVTTFYGESFQD